MKEQYGVDGLMIGRAAIGNPWIFREIKSLLNEGTQVEPPSLQERVAVLKKHLSLEIADKGERYAIMEIRKFYSGYFKDLPDFKKHRMRLMMATTREQIDEIIREFTIDS